MSNPLGFAVLSVEQLLDLLRRAHSGESPDVLLAEWWANASREQILPPKDEV